MKSDWMVLGENCCYSMDSSVTGLNNNVIVCGGSGSGKTMSVTESRLLETKNSSLIVTVTKRRVVNKYTEMFRQRGYEVLDLDLAYPDKSSVKFDPLVGVKDAADVRFLAESIVKADGSGIASEPYWDNSAISLLCAEIGLVQAINPDATFSDVLDFHGTIKISTSRENARMASMNVEYKFEWLRNKYPDHYANTCWQSFSSLSTVTAGCVYATLNTALDAMFTPALRRMMAYGETVDFERIATTKSVLFITSSAVNTALHKFVNIFYGRIFTRLFEFAEAQPDGKLPIPVQVICDDFATGGQEADFAEYISIFREKQLSVMLLIQSESQLKQMYGPANATTIINNCDTYLYMGGMDVETALEIKHRVNKSIEEVMDIPLGQMYVFRRGRKPQLTRRYDILHDVRYQKVTAHYDRMLEREKAERIREERMREEQIREEQIGEDFWQENDEYRKK